MLGCMACRSFCVITRANSGMPLLCVSGMQPVCEPHPAAKHLAIDGLLVKL